MKRFYSLLVCTIIALSSAFTEDFDTILRSAATELISETDGKMNSVAVVAIKTDWGDSVADFIQSELEYYFIKKMGAGNVVSRDDFTKSLIAKEIDYSRSGVVSDETLQEWGSILGVDSIVHGEFVDIATGWQLILKVTHTTTGKHLATWRGKIDANDRDIAYMIQKDGKKRPGFVAQPVVVQTPAPAKTDSKAEKMKAQKPVKVDAKWDFVNGKNAGRITGIGTDSKVKLEKNITVPCDKGSGATLEFLGGGVLSLYYTPNHNSLNTSIPKQKTDFIIITTENECTLVIVGGGTTNDKSFNPSKINGFDVNGKEIYTRTKASDYGANSFHTWNVPLVKGRNVISVSGMRFESFTCK